MTIEGARLDMVNALKAIKPAVRKSQLPATSQVLVTSGLDEITLETCDFDLRARALVSIGGGCDGFMADHAELLRWFSSVAEDSYTIERKERSVVLECGRSTYEVKVSGADCWPFEAVEIAEGHKNLLQAGAAHALLGAVKYAVTGARRAGIPSTILLRHGDGALEACATDNHRAGIVAMDHDPIDEDVQVSPKALAMASEAGGEIRVSPSVGGNWMAYGARRLTVFDRQTETSHPDYRLMPSGGEGAVLVAEEVIPALTRASMAQGKTSRVAIEGDAGFIRFRAQSDMARATESCSSDGGVGDVEWDFNPGYILDAIKACGSKLVRVTSHADSHTLVIEPAEETPFAEARHIITGIKR